MSAASESCVCGGVLTISGILGTGTTQGIYPFALRDSKLSSVGDGSQYAACS